ncbi:hypothetical protein [Candidatus Lokiarchaeum ossiferum]|uniref:hypothetical protein n=1 Tax=Candidatus Lokiarchaeum ossiferum TaxID=2951803 RepID=UPI00352EA533
MENIDKLIEAESFVIKGKLDIGIPILMKFNDTHYYMLLSNENAEIIIEGLKKAMME